MEMTIEESIKAQMFLQYNNLVFAEKEEIVAFIFREYEQRLKADMVAMLEDLDLQIDESAAYNLEVAKVQRLIRDKIDKLKESKE